jgi:hypothetical protein
MNKLSIVVTGLILGLLTGCSTPPRNQTSSTRAEPKWDLSVDAFIEEMIYPQGMARTHQFDAYTPGSYHIRKIPLIDSIMARNTNEHRRVEALVLLGPAGPLWSYNAITIISTNPASENVLMNHLVFAHARITYKSTRILPRKQMDALFQKLLAQPALRDIRSEDRQEDAEWNLSATVTAFGDSPTTRVLPDSAKTNEVMDVSGLNQTVNEILGGELATTTYSTKAKK